MVIVEVLYEDLKTEVTRAEKSLCRRSKMGRGSRVELLF